MYRRKLYPILLLILTLFLAPASLADDGGITGWIEGVWGAILEAVGFGDPAATDPDAAHDKVGGFPDPGGGLAQNDDEGDPPEEPEMGGFPDPFG